MSSPDIYLGFAGLFISYFLKIAVACLFCWILAALLHTPRQRFTLWLGFVLSSFAYWIYAVSTFLASTVSIAGSGAVPHPVPQPSHLLLVPAKFQYATLICGRILGCVYVLGVLLLVAVGIWKRMRLRLLLGHGSAPSSALQHLFSKMCGHFGIRNCGLLIVSGVNSPATVYWWRPRIVLPRICEQWGEAGLLADILSHELAHVTRRDYFWSSITDAICGLLFFHPAVWQARKQMRIHREMACDLAVVSARPEHRADYAQTLTQVARLCLPRKYPVVGIDFAAAPSLLRHRVEAILDDSEKNSQISGTRRICRAFAGVALVTAYGFLCFAMALAIAFVPSSQPSSDSVTASLNSPAAAAPIHKIKRTRTQPEAEHFVTESPAYRLSSASGSSADTRESSFHSGEHAVADSTGADGTLPMRPGSGPKSPSVDRTVESVVVAVGAVLGGDKDDRGKRK